MTDELNGTAKKIDACTIKLNVEKKLDKIDNIVIGINSVEQVLSTRLPTENFSGLINALRTLNRSNPTDEDVKAALVSCMKTIFCLNVLNFRFYNVEILFSFFLIGIFLWNEKYQWTSNKMFR